MLPNCDKNAAQNHSEANPPVSVAAENLNIKIADFLPQSIAIDAQQVGGADLVAAGGDKGRCQQGIFDLPQDPVIQAGGRQTVVEPGEIRGQMPFYRGAE